MNTASKKIQPRWRVTEENALNLERIRRLHGYKSWDDFFQAMIAEQNGTIPPKTEKIESLDITCALTKLDPIQKLQIKILTWLEEHNEASQSLQTELEELNFFLERLNTLLELALQTGTHPDSNKQELASKSLSKLRQRIQNRA